MTKTLTLPAPCKHCGATTMIVKQHVSENYFPVSTGVTTKSCPKCNKTSSYTIRIEKGEIVDVK